MARIKVTVEKSGFLNGTIDPHDPIWVRFRIQHDGGVFWLTVVSVNWGRGYKPGELRNNVERVLEHVDGREHVVLLIQELDEADSAPEHRTVREELKDTLAPAVLVEWWCREPIVVSGAAKVRRERKVMTMDQGSVIGGPPGTGPRRFCVSCIAVIEGVRIGLWNTHPHRGNTGSHKVGMARRLGERVVAREVDALAHLAQLVIGGGDMNDRNYPKSHPREKTAFERGFDTIRYVVA